MRTLTRIVLWTLLLVFGALAGCGEADLTGPPALRLGRDECGECGMLINEDRSACGVLIDNRGRREYMLFDDIGCMLDIERERGADLVVLERYVRDHGDKSWVAAEAAVFLFTEPAKLRTPMGSGIAAYASRSHAEQAQRTHGGRLLTYAELAVARQTWMEDHFGKPDPRR